MSAESVTENGSDACSMPSLSTLSMPSLTLSADSGASIPSDEVTIPSSIGDNGCASLATSINAPPLSTTVEQNNRSGEGNDANWARRIQQEMLAVDAARSNLSAKNQAARPSLLQCDPGANTTANEAPYLHTAQRPESRQRNRQSRLLREADCQLLRAPMKLPVFSGSSEILTCQRLEKKKAVARAKMTERPTTAPPRTAVDRPSCGTQRTKVDAPKSKGVPTQRAPAQTAPAQGAPAQNKTQAIATKPRDRSVQCTLGAIPETQPTKKGVSFAGHLKSGGGAKSDGKSTAVDPSPAMSPPKEIANSYEPLYKVLAVSADRKATSIKQKGDASKEVFKSAAGQKLSSGVVEASSPQEKEKVAVCSGPQANAHIKAAGAKDLAHSPFAPAAQQSYATITPTPYRSSGAVGESLMKKYERPGKISPAKPLSPVAGRLSDTQSPPPSSSRKEDNSDRSLYQAKLISLEKELKGIRHLLEDTKRSKQSVRGPHIPSSIAVPARGIAQPCRSTFGSNTTLGYSPKLPGQQKGRRQQ